MMQLKNKTERKQKSHDAQDTPKKNLIREYDRQRKVCNQSVKSQNTTSIESQCQPFRNNPNYYTIQTKSN